MKISLVLGVTAGLLATQGVSPASAKRTEFHQLGRGCWERERNGLLERYCFEGDKVDAVVFGKEEGLGNSGIYRAYRDEVIILGFPGEGWPSVNYVDKCGYRFENHGSVLILSNCGIAGEWKRSRLEEPVSR